MSKKIELHVPKDKISCTRHCKRLPHVLEDFTVCIYSKRELHGPIEFTVYIYRQLELHVPKDTMSHYTCPISASFTFLKISRNTYTASASFFLV